MGKIIDITGQRFGRLVVIEYIKLDKNRQSIWKCKCDCGNEVLKKGYYLRNKWTNSCGCLNKEKLKNGFRIYLMNKAKRLPNNEASFNSLYYCYKRSAKIKNHVFEIEKESFKELTSQNCFYCNKKPLQEKNMYRKTEKYIYNGLDRVDSTKGYTLDNVVPCCKRCNVMKNNMKLEDFKKHIIDIYNNFINDPVKGTK